MTWTRDMAVERVKLIAFRRQAQAAKRQTMLERYGTFGVHQSTIKMIVTGWSDPGKYGIRTRYAFAAGTELE